VSEHEKAGALLGLTGKQMASKDFEFVKTEPATDYRGRPAGVDVHYRLAGEDKVLSYSNKKEAEHLRRYSARNDAEAAGDRDDPPMGGQNRSLPKGGAYPPSRFHGVPSQAEVKAKGLGAFVKGSAIGNLGKATDRLMAAREKLADKTAKYEAIKARRPKSEEAQTRIHEARVIAEAHPDERAELKQMAKDRQRDQPSVETGAKGGRFVRLPGGGKRYVKE